MHADYAAGTRRLQQFFARKGLSAAQSQDLAQDTWVRWLSKRNRGGLEGEGAAALRPLGRMAHFVLLNYWERRPDKDEVLTGEFADEAGIIQLQTDEPPPKEPSETRARRAMEQGMCRRHHLRPAVAGKTMCQECLNKMRAANARRRAGA